MRDAFGQALRHLGSTEQELIVLDADNGRATRVTTFAERFPDRFINVGCAEQNLVGVAAGIAATGVPVVVSTFSVFLCGRAFEQIRNTVCQGKLPVTFVGTHAGVTVGFDGSSHFAIEDLALMRALPEMRVFVPSSDAAVAPLLKQAVSGRSPAYLRISRRPSPGPVSDDHDTLGSRLLRRGDDVTIFACGVMVERALSAAEVLARGGVAAEVVDVWAIKPLPEQAIRLSLARTGAGVVVEEHSCHGGLGDAIARAVSAAAPAPLEFVAVPDVFGRSGNPDQILDLLGLNVDYIVAAGRRAAARRLRPSVIPRAQGG